MYIKNFISNLINVLMVLVNYKSELDKYMELKVKDVPSIKKEDLPNEFSEKAFKTIDDFIKKTVELNYECVIYFDYITGEILKCAFGELDKVSLKFENNEFRGHFVASIHNHPFNVFSPPSARNFGIFLRDFEDYELISSYKELWILKSKYTDEKLMLELNVASIELFKSAWEQANKISENIKMVEFICEKLYGIFLLKYINDKNINGIQLTKKGVLAMTINLENYFSEFETFKKISNPKEYEKVKEDINNPYILTGIDRLCVFYELMGLEFDEDFFKKAVEDCCREYGV